MYQRKVTRQKEVALHFIFWIIWLYFNALEVRETGIHFISFSLFHCTYIFVFFISFYCNYLIVFPQIFNRFRWYKVFFGVLMMLILFICIRYFVEQILTLYIFQRQNYPVTTGTIYYIYDNVFFAIKPLVISSVFWMILFIVKTMDYNSYIIQQQKNIEIKFLKAQINPHFVFNTLNNIYSMVYLKSPNALSAIEKLSDIMRFTTYESQLEFIKLSDELKYIYAYIELEELRKYQKSFVKWTLEVSNDGLSIPPYLFFPLIENALKHGEYSNELPICVSLKGDSEQLVFHVENKIGTARKDEYGGVGLENLKNRLEILYPKKYDLNIGEINGFFSIKLSLCLK